MSGSLPSSKIDMLPQESFLQYTQDVMRQRMIQPYIAQFACRDGESLEDSWNIVFESRKRAGQEMSSSQWMINGVFPKILYEENGSNLKQLLRDPRFHEVPTATSTTWSSFFGRLDKPREGLNKSFLEHLLERGSRKSGLSYPFFFFDTEYPEYILRELVNNSNQIRSGRTAAGCIMNMSFKWDNAEKELVMCVIMRVMLWSHSYGDFFGSNYILQVINKELGLDRGRIALFACSTTMDAPVLAKKFLGVING